MSKFYYQPKKDLLGLAIGVCLAIIGFFALRAICAWMLGSIHADATDVLVAVWVQRIYWIITGICVVSSVLSIYAKTFSVLLVGNSEVITKWGWISKNTSTLPSRKIRSCSKHQSVLQRLCDTMTISITTSGDTSEVYFSNIDAREGQKAYERISRLAHSSARFDE